MMASAELGQREDTGVVLLARLVGIVHTPSSSISA